MMVAKAVFDRIRSLGFGSISGTYASVGGVTTRLVRVFKISNNTQGDMFFTTNDSQDEMFVAAGSFTLYDVQSNANGKDDKYVLPIGTQFSVKQITAPVEKAVYIEILG